MPRSPIGSKYFRSYEVEMVPLDQLKSWEENPREIDPDKLQALKKFIKKYGLLTPLLVDAKDKRTVLGGNMRLRALKELGVKKVPVRFIRPKSRKEAVELALLDNAQFGKYMKAKLLKLLQSVEGVDVEGITIPVVEIDLDLVRPIRRELLDRKVEGVPFSKQGGIWFFEGGKRGGLVVGDSRLEDTWRMVDQITKGKKFRLCLTSPPYFIGIKYRSHKDRAKKEREIVQFNLEVVQKILPRLQGFLMWNLGYGKVARGAMLDVFVEIKRLPQVEFVELIIWDKGRGVLSKERSMLSRMTEFVGVYNVAGIPGEEDIHDLDVVGVYRNTTAKYVWRTGKIIGNIWKIPGLARQNKLVPASFPVVFAGKGISITTRTEEWVLDPFVGSGTTVAVALRMRRNAVGIELDPLTADFAALWVGEVIGDENVVWKLDDVEISLREVKKEKLIDPNVLEYFKEFTKRQEWVSLSKWIREIDVKTEKKDKLMP